MGDFLCEKIILFFLFFEKRIEITKQYNERSKIAKGKNKCCIEKHNKQLEGKRKLPS